MKQQLSEKDKADKSLLVWQQLEALECFQKASVILMYWSMPDEVSTHDFILSWHSCKRIILPVVDKDRLRLKPFCGTDTLQPTAYMNLYEPQGEDYPTPQDIELAIVPGIAFDRDKHRLGRGKAYYDQLLPQLRAYKIGVGFDFQFLNTIPADPHDVSMDKVLFG